MKVVIIGRFPDTTKKLLLESFPCVWDVSIVPPEDAEGKLAEAEVLIPEHIPVDAALLRKAPHLKLVQTGAGYDNIDVSACTARGIQVCNAAGVNANAVAEHVMALLLCWYKNIAMLDRYMKSGADENALCYTGSELSGKTLGIAGFGHVGKAVAEYARAFHMRVLVCSRRPVDTVGVEERDFDSLLRESDVVSLHLPLNESTRGLIGAAEFAKMKPDALLINTARGALLDEEQLVSALRQGVIGGACLDVFEEEPLRADHPLRTLENVILTPHTAGLPDGVKFHKKRCAFFVSNIEHILKNEAPECRINDVLT